MVGLITVITAGLAIFSSDPLRYYYSPTFRFKIWVLLAAIVFNYTFHRRVSLSGSSPFIAKATGAISVILWGTVVFSGLFFAFNPGGY